MKLISLQILAFSVISVPCFAAAFAPANRPYDVQNYRIRLNLDPAVNLAEFDSQVELTIKATGPLETVTLDREDLNIKKVVMLGQTGKKLSYDTKDPKTVTIVLPYLLKKGATMTFGIEYSGKVGTNHRGLFRVTDPDEPNRGNLIFTHFEPLGARAFYPCNDEPYDKALTEVIIGVPAALDALSNGKRIADRKFRNKEADWHEIHWKMDKPMSTYLVALAVGPFKSVVEKDKGREISTWVGETKVDKARYANDVTHKAFSFYETFLNTKYPWSKYATVGLPTFMWGGMENTTITFQNQERTVLNDPNSEFEKKRIAGLSAHELAHQWFGDDVTLAWWDDVWLNEAFASYMSTLATQKLFNSDEAQLNVTLNTWDDYFRQEDGPRSHPIVDKGLTTPDDAFDSISYTKGEAVLRMLHNQLGDKKFRDGLALYLKTHAYANATYLDLFTALEQTSNAKLAAFRDSWLLQRGYPVISYGGEWDGKTNKYHLKIAQASNHKEDKSLFVFRLPVVVHRKTTPAFHKELTLDVSGATAGATLDLPAAPEWLAVNTGSVILARVKQENRDVDSLVLQATQDPDPFIRLRATLDLSLPLFQGDKLSSDEERGLLTVLQKDSSPYVRIAVLDSFKNLKKRWLPEKVGDALFVMAQQAVGKERPVNGEAWDTHGWREWRATLVGSLGKVEKDEVLPFLEKLLAKKDLPLDELSKATIAVALQGDDRSAEILKSAYNLHKGRGYSYQYWTQIAFGAFENKHAVDEIRLLVKASGSDYIGRVGRYIRDNQTVRNSKEWSKFLQEIVLQEAGFSDEVKSRVLSTIEEVKESHVQGLLESILKDSKSERLRDASKKILDKNFKS